MGLHTRRPLYMIKLWTYSRDFLLVHGQVLKKIEKINRFAGKTQQIY